MRPRPEGAEPLRISAALPAQRGQLRLCVFCGARPGGPASMQIAREAGRLIGLRGYRLVYGAGGSGLMGELAWAAHRHGAEITGIVPRFLYERERALAAPPYETVLPDTMLERKQLMIDRSDAFLALPGGYGTLDEVMEIVSLKALGVCDKPLVLLDVDGFWESLVCIDETLRARGFVDDRAGRFFEIAATAADALDIASAGLTGAVADRMPA